MSRYSPQPHYPLPTNFGGKGDGGNYQAIINQIRPHTVYVEPFLGRGIIFRRKRAARYSLLGDTNRSLLIAHGTGLASITAQPTANLDAVSQSANHFAGIFHHDIEWIRPTIQQPQLKQSLVRFMHEPWHRTLAFLQATLIPVPYHPSTVCTYVAPPLDMAADEVEKLLAYLLTMPGDVLIKTLPNEQYAQKLKKWRRVELKREGKVRPWLFCNFPEPTKLHDPQFFGADYREREKVKDLTDSWIRQLLSKPKPVQHMMLEHLTAAVERGELRKKLTIKHDSVANLVADGPVVSAAFDLAIPTVEPVSSANYRPYPPTGMTIVDHTCWICGKQKETSRPFDRNRLLGFGYVPVTALEWIDDQWLCSMVCTEKAAGRLARDSKTEHNCT